MLWGGSHIPLPLFVRRFEETSECWPPFPLIALTWKTPFRGAYDGATVFIIQRRIQTAAGLQLGPWTYRGTTSTKRFSDPVERGILAAHYRITAFRNDLHSLPATALVEFYASTARSLPGGDAAGAPGVGLASPQRA